MIIAEGFVVSRDVKNCPRWYLTDDSEWSVFQTRSRIFWTELHAINVGEERGDPFQVLPIEIHIDEKKPVYDSEVLVK